MKSIISVNNKFMELTPKKLIEVIIGSKHTKGLEVCVDYYSDKEMKYLKDLVFEIKRNNLILQIHGNSEMPLKDQFNFLKILEDYATYLEDKIVITFHSIYDEVKEESLKKTYDFINEVINYVDNDKLVICLENLNDLTAIDRLEKEYITSIVLNYESLFFTYDMGHELVDHGKITNLNDYMIEEIRNVHIHTHDEKGVDHFPIYKNDKYWNEIIKSILFLINNNYKYNIVYEYDLYACYGDTIEEKIKDYLKSIDLVSEHYIR